MPPRATGKEWESRNPRVTEHLVWPGTNGHTQVENRIVQVDGGRVWVESEGHGTIKPGPNRFLGVEVRSDAIFDTALGKVVDGLDVVDAIAGVDIDPHSGAPTGEMPRMVGGIHPTSAE